MANANSIFTKLVVASFVLSLALIVLSSTMRLSNQGLGCPDWPQCYGLIDTAKYARDIATSSPRKVSDQLAIPPTFVERAHRIVASLLQIFIIAIAIIAWRRRRHPGQAVALPFALLALSLFLALLGIWYGSPLLRPPVVMANLLGGIAMLGMLWWLCLARNNKAAPTPHHTDALHKWALLGLFLVVTQTALGGWISSNFAALACTTIPHCNGAWWPEMNFSAAFTLRDILTVNAAGRVEIDQAAITAIQMVHRIGAILVLLFITGLAYRVITRGGRFRAVGMAILTILLLQILLGIGVVLLSSPLGVVVAHNTVAALLWLSLITLIYLLREEAGKTAGPT